MGDAALGTEVWHAVVVVDCSALDVESGFDFDLTRFTGT